MKTICTKCGEECEVITVWGSDPDEFWGAPCQRPWSEDASECCEAEVEEIDDEEMA